MKLDNYSTRLAFKIHNLHSLVKISFHIVATHGFFISLSYQKLEHFGSVCSSVDPQEAV